MKAIWRQTRCTLVAATVIGFMGSVVAGGPGFGPPVPAPAAVPGEHEQYQRSVLTLVADSARRDPRADIGGRWIPGPLAMRYAREGLPITSAISRARDEGESPSFVPNDVVRARQLLSARGRW